MSDRQKFSWLILHADNELGKKNIVAERKNVYQSPSVLIVTNLMETHFLTNCTLRNETAEYFNTRAPWGKKRALKNKGKTKENKK